ncbi:hypothetical protein JHK85_009657 [Glycine max]|nr:hypothetical protein JHK85_009657 [Glycine max]
MDGDIYNEDTNDEDIDDEETNEEFYEATYTYVMAIYALIDILNQFLNMMRGEHIERPLTRRQITSRGYDYIHKALNDDPAIFRQVYRMYPDVFRKLCTIIREKTPLEDTRFICVEEMLASFLQIVGQNTRYCVIRNTFGRSQFATKLIGRPGREYPSRHDLFPLTSLPTSAVPTRHVQILFDHTCLEHSIITTNPPK